MELKFDIPHTQVHRITRQFSSLPKTCSCLASGWRFSDFRGRTLFGLFREVFKPAVDFRGVVAEVLFMLVMVEVVRLLYLREHRVAVDFMVELGIVATLREIVLRGVIEVPWQQVAALTGFLLALGALLRLGDLRVVRNKAPRIRLKNPKSGSSL